MRATEQSGVRSTGSSIGWALIFAVLAAFALQLSALTARASADDQSPVEATQDEAVAAPAAGEDGTTSESPAADPVLDPGPTSPEPAAPSGVPATVESSKPDAGAPALPPSAESDSPDVTHAGHPTGPAESPPATTNQIEGTTPAVPEPLAPLPARRAQLSRLSRFALPRNCLRALAAPRLSGLGQARVLPPSHGGSPVHPYRATLCTHWERWTTGAPHPSRSRPHVRRVPRTPRRRIGPGRSDPSSLRPRRVHRVARCAAGRVRAGPPSSRCSRCSCGSSASARCSSASSRRRRSGARRAS